MTDEENKQRQLDAEAKALRDAARVKELLEDPAIAEFMRERELMLFKLFQVAKTDEERRDVWAQSAAFQALLQGVEAIKSRGKIAESSRNAREANEKRQRGANPRN